MRREGEQLVLDTNVLVYWVRGNAAGDALRAAYELGTRRPRPVVPIVVHGEIRSLARWREWGPAKLALLDELLRGLPAVDIVSGPIVEAYAELESISLGLGRTMGKNDLWIAAIASVLGGVVVTTDADFDPLSASTITLDRLSTKALLAGRVELA